MSAVPSISSKGGAITIPCPIETLNCGDSGAALGKLEKKDRGASQDRDMIAVLTRFHQCLLFTQDLEQASNYRSMWKIRRARIEISAHSPFLPAHCICRDIVDRWIDQSVFQRGKQVSEGSSGEETCHSVQGSFIHSTNICYQLTAPQSRCLSQAYQ